MLLIKWVSSDIFGVVVHKNSLLIKKNENYAICNRYDNPYRLLIPILSNLCFPNVSLCRLIGETATQGPQNRMEGLKNTALAFFPGYNASISHHQTFLGTQKDSRTNFRRTFDHHKCLTCKSNHKNCEIFK